MLISQSNLPPKNQSKTGLQHAIGWRSKEDESNAIADALLRLLDWRTRQMEMREQTRIKAMLTRRRNRERRRTE
jgi:hypothetical protein